MVEAEMVGDEIEDQLKTVGIQFAAEGGQAFVATEIGRDTVISNGVRRTFNIRLGPIRQGVGIGLALSGKAESFSASEQAAAPNAHEPDMSETEMFPGCKF